jgi:hypothetical protein
MAFLRYVKEAFNARPWGMWVPPNWVGLAAFGILGFENYGFWILGAGLELGYLLTLATSGRFQRVIDARDAYAAKQDSRAQLQKLLARLDASDQNRYRALESRCQKVLEHQQESASPAFDLQTQADGLGKLLFVYLRLLLTRAGILRVLEGSSTQSIDLRILDVNRQLQNASNPDLQHSLTDQLAILTERKSRHTEARQKLQFIEAELARIQEQVELIREGLVVTTDPAQLSRRIDQVGDTLGNTSQWIKQQQELLGETEELLSDQPPVVLEVPAAHKA